MSKNYMTRTFRIPIDLYEVLKEESEKEELTISAFTIRTLRKALNVPVPKKDNNN